MTDSNTGPQELPIEESKTGVFDRASLIWAVPILALVVALGAAWRNYNDRGPLISVYFDNAAGVAANETELRYRDITVGTVEAVRFSEELQNVVVEIRVEKDLADYVDSEAQFWVVRPEVSARGVSGLDTVLSGVYIQGAWDTVPGGLDSEFDGMPNAPLLQPDQQGTLFTIRSADTLPGEGTPILYKNVEVGQIGPSLITDDASAVTTQAVIYAPHDSYVTSSTRFWDISGFNFSLGASGARLNFTSLASLISGGITFETMGSGGAPLDQNMSFQLYPDEEAARDEFLIAGESDAVDFIMVFEENLAGLAPGAAIELGGLRVGEVASINGIVDEERFGDDEIRLIATVRISANRIGLGDDTEDQALYDFLETRIQDGLRARLINASILTGGLKVELVDLSDPEPGALDLEAEPFPQIPTAPPDVTDVTATAQGVLQRVNDLPIEEVLTSVRQFLDGATTLIASDDLQAAPTELRGILTAVRDVAESESIQGAPDQIADFLATLQSASTTLDDLIVTLNEAEAAQNLAAALQNTSDTTERLPVLLDELQVLVQNAQSLPVERLSNQVSSVLTEIETLLAGEDLQQVPAEVRAILTSLRNLAESEGIQGAPDQIATFLDTLQSTGTTLDDLIATLEEAGAADNLAATLQNTSDTSERLPALLDELQVVVQNAQSLPVERLSNQVSSLLTEIETLLEGEDVQQVPSELRGILASVRSVTESENIQGLPQQLTGLLDNLQDVSGDVRDMVAELEAEGAQDRLMAAIDNLATASEDLPEITAQAREIVGEADGIALDELANRASALLDATERLIDQESTRQLPEEINTALSSLQATLDELRQGGVVENTNAALASARRAADRVAEATDILPQLAADLRRVANSAGTTLSAYSEDSQFSRTTRDAIRQVENAASAIEKLARTIERNPNSLILGR